MSYTGKEIDQIINGDLAFPLAHDFIQILERCFGIFLEEWECREVLSFIIDIVKNYPVTKEEIYQKLIESDNVFKILFEAEKDFAPPAPKEYLLSLRDVLLEEKGHPLNPADAEKEKQ